MRAVEAERAGGADVLKLIETPAPEPGAGEIRIRVEAAGLNFIDVYQRTGLYPMTYPARLGREAAGLVDAVGEGVTRFRPGDRAGFVGGGTGGYAEQAVIAADRAVRLPPAISAELAAAAMLKGMTADMLLRRVFHVKQGHTILVHAAAGGVGSILCQWGAALGARVIGCVGSEAKAELARQQGCAEVLIYDRDDLAARVRELTGGQGVPVVYDSVGKDTFDASLASLARRGTMVTFGNASGPVPAVEPLRLSRGGSLFLTRPTLYDYIDTVEALDESAQAVFDILATGTVKVDIGARFALDQVREAHEALESRRTTGSTVILP